MNKRIFIMIVMMIIVPSVFYAQPIEELKEHLNLTNEQSKELIVLMDKFHKREKVQYLDIREQRLELKRELLKKSPNEKEIKKILDRIASLRSDLEFYKIKNILNIKRVLTRDQFLRWKRMLEEHYKRESKNKQSKDYRSRENSHDNKQNNWQIQVSEDYL